MALDKAIEHGREHRKPYRKSKSHTPSCRNNGGCAWCKRSRTIQTIRARKKADDEIENAGETDAT